MELQTADFDTALTRYYNVSVPDEGHLQGGKKPWHPAKGLDR